MLNYKYITYRFGKIAVEYYYKMQKYLMEDLESIFVEGERDESYVYGAYFVSPRDAQKSDAIFRSLHFERITLTDNFEGTPADAYHKLQREVSKNMNQIEELERKPRSYFPRGHPSLWQRKASGRAVQ